MWWVCLSRCRDDGRDCRVRRNERVSGDEGMMMSRAKEIGEKIFFSGDYRKGPLWSQAASQTGRSLAPL
jgi:hypothetical protein